MTARWSVTWSAFWPGLAAATGSGVWWQTHCEPFCQPPTQASEGCDQVAPRDRVLALARHPSFTTAVAGRVVRELRWEDLVDVWDETGRLLAKPSNPRHLLGYIRTRAALAGRASSAATPASSTSWYVGQWESLAHRRQSEDEGVAATRARGAAE